MALPHFFSVRMELLCAAVSASNAWCFRIRACGGEGASACHRCICMGPALSLEVTSSRAGAAHHTSSTPFFTNLQIGAILVRVVRYDLHLFSDPRLQLVRIAAELLELASVLKLFSSLPRGLFETLIPLQHRVASLSQRLGVFQTIYLTSWRSFSHLSYSTRYSMYL